MDFVWAKMFPPMKQEVEEQLETEVMIGKDEEEDEVMNFQGEEETHENEVWEEDEENVAGIISRMCDMDFPMSS